MFESFTPKLYIDDVFALDLPYLQQRGIKAMLLDLDNTLTLWHDDYIRPEILQLLRDWERAGMSLCLLSNNRGQRVEYMAGRLGIACVKKANKPGVQGYLRACRLLQVQPHEAAMVGDQLLTDMLGANRAGLFSVLVKPIAKREMIGTRFISRNIERLIFPFLRRNLAAAERQNDK